MKAGDYRYTRPVTRDEGLLFNTGSREDTGETATIDESKLVTNSYSVVTGNLSLILEDSGA